jgi:tetratricopeptide (TPR) repeat protein
VVQLPKEPELRVAKDITPQPVNSNQPVGVAAATDRNVPARTPGPIAAAPPKTEPRRNFLQKINPISLLSKGDPARAEGQSRDPRASDAQGADLPPTPIAAGTGPRYRYISPPKPAPGKTAEAELAFLEGVKAHRDHRVTEAMAAYRRAIHLDPALFGAHFNLGLATTDRGEVETAMQAYETALAIRPDSLDARYNFALLLKQSGYVADSIAQLERLLSYYPNEPRAHVMLGNMYAQQFKNVPKAREHYLKALEADPKNPQAGAIRFWLVENQK